MTDTTTTTTQHWLLLKYSRSRSLVDGAPGSSSSSTATRTVAGQGSDDNIQWDH